MERSHRVAEIWPWLPAFRAIAELEHLGRAADSLHVSPPSLSRTLRLLEAALGHPLFHRRGRGIQLNDEGRLLLGHVRDSMRWIDEGMAKMRARGSSGRVRIGALGVAAHVHVPRLIGQLVARHPELLPEVSTPSPTAITSALLQGQLDLVVSSIAASAPGLSVVQLTDVTNSVYCGPGHALYSRRNPSEEAVLAHPFVAPPSDSRGMTSEGWPADRSRKVASSLDRMLAGVEACASGNVLAVLPDLIARQAPGKLRALRAIPIPSVPVYAARRRPLGDAERIELVVELLLELDAVAS